MRREAANRGLHWMLLATLVLLSLGIAVNPVLASLAAVGMVAVSAATAFRRRLPSAFLWSLGVGLLGYAFLGRGFAYLGTPPVYVGEVLLVVGLLALSLTGGIRLLLRSPVAWLLVGFMVLGAAATVPHLSTYGLDALRDGAVWGYGLFALLVAASVLRTGSVKRILAAYGRLLPWFLLWTPIGVVAYRLAFEVIPRLPGSGVPLLNPKGGDIAVHLAGILAFLALGLSRHGSLMRANMAEREWIWWVLWLLACITVFNVRAAMLTVAVVVLCLLVVRPLARWGKVMVLGVVMAIAFVGLELEVDLGTGRTVSAEGLATALSSIFGETGQSTYDGSRRWRLAWWGDIVGYTVFGEYFWTGKGYGVNLADADGYQVFAESALRSPHNSHLTILARGGVPAALSWVVLQVAFVISLLLAFYRARREGRSGWASVNLWVLAYWLAFMANSAFDVYLEGPQGGIWFWSLFGFGIAVLEVQRGLRQAGGSHRVAAP